MENTDYTTTAATEGFIIICDCGANFSSEELHAQHLENGHSDVAGEPSNVELQEDDTVYYLPSSHFIKEELVELDNEDNSMVEQEDLEEFLASNQIVQIEYKEDVPELNIAEIKTEQAISEPHVKPVVFKKETLLKQQVIIAQQNQEHCYERSPYEIKEFYYCQVCGKTFQTELSVSRHLRKVHLNTVKATNTIREKPRKTAPLPKKVICDVCGNKYTSHAALRYHQRVHTGEKPYKCEMCPKAFTMPLYYQVHVRTHTGERPYECAQCPKAFSNRAALLRHDRVHTGEKPYECPECKKCFTQSNSMKLHIQTVHYKMPAPYKSAARKLKTLMRQQELSRASGKNVRASKSKVKYHTEDSQESQVSREEQAQEQDGISYKNEGEQEYVVGINFVDDTDKGYFN